MTQPADQGTVFLHVGAMKSGTTYLQRVLVANKDELRRRNILFPGQRWVEQVKAAEDLVGRHPAGKPANDGAWSKLIERIHRHDGPVVVSMETLGSARPRHVKRVIHDLAPRRVRVIVTARDAGRVIPAQWQEWVQNGGTVSFATFLRACSLVRWRYSPIARRLWWSQDISRILRTWRPLVADGDLVVVTLPPDGSDRSLLWSRFCEAIETDPSGFAHEVKTNESLGAVSVELVRRVNRVARRRHEPWTVMSSVKHQLSKTVLATRRSSEPKLAIPANYHQFALRVAKVFVSGIEKVRPVVIGDLDELRLRQDQLTEAGPDTLSTPEKLTADELLDAAVDGLLGLTIVSDEQLATLVD